MPEEGGMMRVLETWGDIKRWVLWLGGKKAMEQGAGLAEITWAW